MKKIFRFCLAVLTVFFAQNLSANNVAVSNIALVNQNTTAGLNATANHTFVQFDLTWDNSWRNSAGPANYDAAWVFVKFQAFGSPEWFHATLSSTDADHTITNNNGVSMNIDAASNGRGVIVHRTANGNGAINLTGMRLKWNYRTGNVVHDTANVTVRVFAIEMVYIPQGEFFVGDGTLTTPTPTTGAFRINNVGNNRPYRVISEGALSFLNGSSTGGGANELYNGGVYTGAYTLPAAFPKGFAAFYTMKYELSVKQYTDFFNTLRTDITTAKTNRNLASSQPSRCTFTYNNSPLTDATTGATTGDRAQGGMSQYDALTYADWAGLRPMTELEFEKIARGCDRTGASPGIPVYPVNGEYAWGENANLVNITTPTTGDGTANESVATSSTMNANTSFASGPVRCGIFAAKNPSANQRRLTGASYYGVMELTGNIEEYVYSTIPYNSSSSTISTAASTHSFNGSHGDGNINSSTGEFNTQFSTSAQMVSKGGYYSAVRRVSERGGHLVGWSSNFYSGLSYSTTSRHPGLGFRAVISGNQF